MTAVAAPAVRLGDERHLVDLIGTDLSAEQLRAVTAPLEPSVVVAGAGSGKTTVMCARVVWLVGRGLVAPEQVLGLTFSRKAAAELATRIRTALARLGPLPTRPDEQPGVDAEPTVSTYHAYAGSLITEHGLRLGIEPDLRVVADATRYQLAARVVAGAPASSTSLSHHLPTVVEYVLELDAQLQDHLVSPERVRRHGRLFRAALAGQEQTAGVLRAADVSRARDDLLGLVAAYRRAKDDAGITEFADQMAGGARLAIECPEVGDIERQRFRVVLLDEYQDTSVSQRQMLQGLFADERGRGHPVTAVGDPCQAIYGWRGASADNIDAFPWHFPRADGTDAPRRHLTVNRRCAGGVLDLANLLALPLYAAHASGAPLVAPPSAPRGTVRTVLQPTVAHEVAWVADEVVRLHERHTAEDGGTEPAWSQIAVLVRDRGEVAELARALRRRRVPVEVVGLSGLLSQPEVADVLGTLRVVHELTANAALLRLLSGPRWRIGVRDLALLGERASDLVAADRPDAGGLRDRLDEAVRGADPTEVVALADALADPGDKDYSAEARTRFGQLAAELETLRGHAGEPLVDLVRRTIDVLGLEVELAAAPGPDSEQARDNLALLVDAVADFAGSDTGASLPGLLAYLDAEALYERGMSVAEPALTNAVTLLTVHSAKGLEWRSVLVPFLSHGAFPSAKGRSRWPTVSSQLPWPLRGDAGALPVVSSWTPAGLTAYAESCREADLLEERRLVYVAVTRAARDVVLSGHWWGRIQEKPRGPSPFLSEAHDHQAAAGPTSEAPWRSDPPAAGAANPLVAGRPPVGFPGRLDDVLLARRRRAAAAVRAALAGAAQADGARRGDDRPGLVDRTRLDGADNARLDRLCELDSELDALLDESSAARAGDVTVPLPGTVSTTLLMRLRDDADGLARDLARPMPRRPAPAARFGSRFHTWVEGHVGQPALLDPTEIPGRAEDDIDDNAELAELVELFCAGRYGERVPEAVETPFHLVLRGQLVAGRIDAVYRGSDGGYEVVDWKTGRHQDADPTQLALYRLAWAELTGLPLDQVRALFYYVRTGDVVEPALLPDRAGLEALVGG